MNSSDQSSQAKKIPTLINLDYYNLIEGLVVNISITWGKQINILFFSEKSFKKYKSTGKFPKVHKWFDAQCGTRISYVKDPGLKLKDIDIIEFSQIARNEYAAIRSYYKGQQIIH